VRRPLIPETEKSASPNLKSPEYLSRRHQIKPERDFSPLSKEIFLRLLFQFIVYPSVPAVS
jgi:hypothetical protein